MTSQTGFSSNMLFQSINDDLNASLATADELSREFSSLLHEVTPPPQPDHQQTSSFYAPASSSPSSASSSIQRDMLLSVTPSITTTASSPTSPPTSFPGSPVSYSGSLTGSSSASRMSGPQLLSPGIRQLTPSPLSSPQLQSDGLSPLSPLSPLSRYSAPFDGYGQQQQQQQQRSPMQSPRSQRRPSPSHYDPGSMGRRSPRPGQLSAPTASASIQREQQQQQQRSPNQSPRSPRRSSPRHGSPRHGSPSHYNRSPRGSTGYADTSPSLSPTSPAASFDLLQRGRSAQQMQPLAAGCLSPHDPGSMGRRSPRHDRSPSPCVRLNAPTASTLPRNFGGLQQTEEGVQRQKKAGRWNETDLDATFDGKPHHTYDTTEWMRPAVPSSNWRESNLDGPSPAPSPKKDTLSGSSYSHSSLPRSTRITVPPDAPPLSPYHVQPIIGRICIPPANVGPRQRRPIPLSVIMRLQNPHWATAPMAPPWGQGYGDIPAQPPLSEPPLSETPPLSAFQPAFYGEVLNSGDVDAELEKLDLVHMPAIPEFAGGSKQGGASEGAPPTAAAPRPLSPTRLQPVVAPQVQQVPDLEELLRIRAEIPRALKRRGSVDQSQPLKKASHYQPNQYKHLINKLFRRKGLQQRGEERGSDSSDDELPPPSSPTSPAVTPSLPPQDYPGYHSILRRSRKQQRAVGRRARLTPLVLLLDGALVGELETVQRAVQEMSDPSQPNDEGITALHNAICGGHYNVVDFLVRMGANVSAPDSHGWTPLHCSASCNDRHLCEFLVRNGAAVMAVTESDGATAALKCDPYALGYEECESFLRGVEEAMGADNSGVLYALWSYPAQAADELSFREGDMVTILQRADGVDWWWASLCGREGFVPNNYFGLFPKVRPKSLC